mmetsp:Transcript_123682/g.361176  ORF Transcript_123682/g.361176 Transcript_123682/m.361176 type:complete len:248 (-) Transcript_123682:896-1639(-)
MSQLQAIGFQDSQRNVYDITWLQLYAMLDHSHGQTVTRGSGRSVPLTGGLRRAVGCRAEGTAETAHAERRCKDAANLVGPGSGSTWRHRLQSTRYEPTHGALYRLWVGPVAVLPLHEATLEEAGAASMGAPAPAAASTAGAVAAGGRRLHDGAAAGLLTATAPGHGRQEALEKSSRPLALSGGRCRAGGGRGAAAAAATAGAVGELLEMINPCILEMLDGGVRLLLLRAALQLHGVLVLGAALRLRG